MVINNLLLEGHDSELFSFLPDSSVETLRQHPAAGVPLWTFGRADSLNLQSVTMWNTYGCLAFAGKPTYTNTSDGWIKYKGLVTDDELIQVQSLVLVRYLFVQGYCCLLEDRPWITTPADRTLERLGYIRGWGGRSTESEEWGPLMDRQWEWARRALDRVDAFIPF